MMKRLIALCLMATACVLGILAQEDCEKACCAGQSIYDFKVKDDAGNEVSLSNYKGKVLLILSGTSPSSWCRATAGC